MSDNPEVVYRAIKRSSWLLEDGKVSIEAFFRVVHERGLSVGVSPKASQEEFRQSIGLKKIYGALAIEYNDVVALQGLAVINDFASHWEIQDHQQPRYHEPLPALPDDELNQRVHDVAVHLLEHHSPVEWD